MSWPLLADPALAAEFRACPLGHHSPALQRLLRAFRTLPVAGKHAALRVGDRRAWVPALLDTVPIWCAFGALTITATVRACRLKQSRPHSPGTIRGAASRCGSVRRWRCGIRGLPDIRASA